MAMPAMAPGDSAAVVAAGSGVDDPRDVVVVAGELVVVVGIELVDDCTEEVVPAAAATRSVYMI